MYDQHGVLRGMILVMVHHGDFIYTTGMMKLATMALSLSFVIKFFAIHRILGPAQEGYTCLQKLPSQSKRN
jgi:hypothetical protein